MSQPLLDIRPVSFRAYFPGSSRYHIVTTVMDHVMYDTAYKREEILNRLKRYNVCVAHALVEMLLLKGSLLLYSYVSFFFYFD